MGDISVLGAELGIYTLTYARWVLGPEGPLQKTNREARW